MLILPQATQVYSRSEHRGPTEKVENTSGFLSVKSAKILLAKVTHMVRCTVSVGGGCTVIEKGHT